MPYTKREKTRLDIQSHSNSELFELISQQMFEGDYTYSFLWISIVNLSRIKPDTTESQTIQKAAGNLIHRCEKGIKDNCAKAMTLRGMMHHLGVGGPVDYNKAMAWYDKAIELDYPAAMNNRAFLYQIGQGGAVNYEEAIALYEKAIGLGSIDAMCNRAGMYKTGLGDEQNFEKAIELYERAIKLGYASAMTQRASMYHNGQGGAVNYEEAIALYEQAIELGCVDAMQNRAFMHVVGQGGDQNYENAIELYERAIKLGSASAMTQRAIMYQHGLGGAVNYPAAIRLYEMAVRLGDKEAKTSLAGMYKEDLQSIALEEDLKSIALELLNVIWDDLLAGLSFTEDTLSLLDNTDCKDKIIARLTDINSKPVTSVKLIRQLKNNSDHPLTKILNDGKTIEEGLTDEFSTLMTYGQFLLDQRIMFFKGNKDQNTNLAKLPLELCYMIMSHAYPGECGM
ncbi:tetratricopeptide repeat protein [Legionella spiritensis]|uniref:Sel1 repeat protein n=1 Tax=Legionella spiritensis TaxID=452 RepID=A0A0W0Z6U2_LEGSP|nr:tetratricopeptide repeat protein [Legionella spiritensis]KTD64850.1 Sel1 repeat protein [Legionella spiritensis]SNV40877.1 Sel1 repeat protein [Legionella spiritensis]